MEALAPRVGVQRQGPKAAQEKAVLTEAMRYFARGAGHDLGVFIDLLAALPEHVSTQTKGDVHRRRASPTGCAPSARPTRCSAARASRPTPACC